MTTPDEKSNLSALDGAAHPFDQTNGIVEDVDRRHGIVTEDELPVDADPDTDEPVDEEEPGREAPDDRAPLINTALITEEVFSDDERRKPRFD